MTDPKKQKKQLADVLEDQAMRQILLDIHTTVVDLKSKVAELLTRVPATPSSPPAPAPAAPDMPASPKAPEPAPVKPPDANAARGKLMEAFKVVIGPNMERNRVFLKAWTGRDTTAELDAETMLRLAAEINKCKDGSAFYNEYGIVHKSTGVVLFGKAAPEKPKRAEEEPLF